MVESDGVLELWILDRQGRSGTWSLGSPFVFFLIPINLRWALYEWE
jgi:hypothetical protein